MIWYLFVCAVFTGLEIFCAFLGQTGLVLFYFAFFLVTFWLAKLAAETKHAT